MPDLVCDCGAIYPFTQGDLIAMGGTRFTCKVCGKTRKMPLAKVFAPAQPPFPMATVPSQKTGGAIRWVISAVLVSFCAAILGSLFGAAAAEYFPVFGAFAAMAEPFSPYRNGLIPIHVIAFGGGGAVLGFFGVVALRLLTLRR